MPRTKETAELRKLKEELEHCKDCREKERDDAIDRCYKDRERYELKIKGLDKKIMTLTIATSAAGGLLGKDAMQEIGEITGIVETITNVGGGDVVQKDDGFWFDNIPGEIEFKPYNPNTGAGVLVADNWNDVNVRPLDLRREWNSEQKDDRQKLNERLESLSKSTLPPGVEKIINNGQDDEQFWFSDERVRYLRKATKQAEEQEEEKEEEAEEAAEEIQDAEDEKKEEIEEAKEKVEEEKKLNVDIEELMEDALEIEIEQMFADLPPLTAISLGELQAQPAADFSISQVFMAPQPDLPPVIVESVPDPEPFIETVVVPGIGSLATMSIGLGGMWWLYGRKRDR